MRKRVVQFSVCLLVSTLAAWSQTATGTIVGTVTDHSGAVISSAKVTVINTGTNSKIEVLTNSEGDYTAPLLPPGTYSVAVSAPGFKTLDQKGIRLQVQQQARVDVVLQVGAVSDSVEVTADAAVVEATTSSIGKVVDNKRIAELPLNTRNVYSLVNLTPGLAGSIGNAHNAVSFSVNGARGGTFDVLVDGSSGAFPTVNGFAGVSVFPSVDAVAEFKLQAQNFPAEFGRSMTAVLNLVYKSGGNDFRGSAFEFLRNSVLDANNFFSNQRGVGLPSFKRNQFGGNIGGPIRRNKLFFLFAYESLRERSFSSTTTTVPTDLERAGNFSQTRSSATQVISLFDPFSTQASGPAFVRTAFPGNIIPQNRWDSVARNVIKYWPTPNQPGDSIGRNNFFNVGSATNNTDNWDIRVDDNLTAKQRLFGRFSYRRYLNAPPQLFPGDTGIAEGRINNNDFGRNAVVDYTNTISPSSLVNVRFNFARNRFLYDNQGLGFVPSSLGLPKSLDSAVDRLMFPAFTVSTEASLGGGDHRQSGFNNYGLAGSFTKIKGNHTIKSGYEGRMLRINVWEACAAGTFNFTAAMTQGPNPAVSSSNSGFGFASFLLGAGSSGNFYQNWKNVASQSFYHAFYIQDDWRITRRLTLNIGLRYDFDTPRTERYNRMSWFDPSAKAALSNVPGYSNLTGALRFVGADGNPRTQFDGDWNDIAPRLGLAYQLDSKTAIRAGFAQLFGPSTLAGQGTVGPYGFRVESTWVTSLDGFTPLNLLSNPFPGGFPPVPGSLLGAATAQGSLIEAPLRNTNTPYTLQYNLTIQRELPGRILLEAAYVGNRGRELSRGGEGGFTLNQLNPIYLSLGSQLNQLVDNPFYGQPNLTGVIAQKQVSRAQLLRPYPQYDTIHPLFSQGATSDYNALQLTFSKRYAKGVTFEGSYTWAKALDTGTSYQNSYDVLGARGVSSVDYRHRFVFSGVYELPIGRDRRFGAHLSRLADAFIGGWQLNGIWTAQSGDPLGISATGTAALFSEASRANTNGGNPNLSGDAHQRLDRWFDTSVFSQPAPYTLGNLSPLVTNLRNHYTNNIDLSLFKQFQVTERVRLQFRSEAFNALNRVRFGSPNTNVNGGANFGRVTSQANSPRQLQFGLKAIF
jgi:hypothetical protein